MRTALAALAALTLLLPAAAREQYAGQYDSVDPAVREWFRSQKIPGGPGKGGSCCDLADGAYAEEDIVNGHYWARWHINGALTAWLPVPPEAVLEKGNRNGAPVVWWFYSGGVPKIRCFAPGAGL